MRKTQRIFKEKIRLPFRIKRPVLAVGAQTKNTLCFAKGNFAYLSLIYPDLSHPQDFLNFKKNANHFLKNNPRIIAHDLHPEYASTKYALRLSPIAYHLSPVQHHHAHIASCMAEHGLKNQKVIGVAFDGTGLGADGRIWGGEFLICNYKNFSRGAHLKEIPLVGGERAILEPWRLVEAWFNFKYTTKGGRLKKIYQAGINSPLSSSMGRLFDAAASLILGKNKADFEAELAMGLERLAAAYDLRPMTYDLRPMSYKFTIIRNKNTYILDPFPALKQITADLKSRAPKERIAYRFHQTVAEIIKRTCLLLRKENCIKRVVLSGGVFQNKLLLRLTLDLLYQEGFKVFIPKNLPPNDSGISLGQAAVAGMRS